MKNKEIYLNVQKKIEEKNIEMMLALKVRKVKKIKDHIANRKGKNQKKKEVNQDRKIQRKKKEAAAVKRNRKIIPLTKFRETWIQKEKKNQNLNQKAANRKKINHIKHHRCQIKHQ